MDGMELRTDVLWQKAKLYIVRSSLKEGTAHYSLRLRWHFERLARSTFTKVLPLPRRARTAS